MYRELYAGFCSRAVETIEVPAPLRNSNSPAYGDTFAVGIAGQELLVEIVSEGSRDIDAGGDPSVIDCAEVSMQLSRPRCRKQPPSRRRASP